MRAGGGKGEVGLSATTLREREGKPARNLRKRARKAQRSGAFRARLGERKRDGSQIACNMRGRGPAFLSDFILPQCCRQTTGPLPKGASSHPCDSVGDLLIKKDLYFIILQTRLCAHSITLTSAVLI